MMRIPIVAASRDHQMITGRVGSWGALSSLGLAATSLINVRGSFAHRIFLCFKLQ